ncbi:MAG: exonuclease domain-containing protein [Clostridiales bacterium]|nr:exonuclease domain-containing protein [Clostridiales bacterium]
MDYIIFDLEWNHAYSSRTKGNLNEIIEIGAVRVNEALEICDSFSQLVKPVYTNKLSSRVKRLTHLTNEQVRAGVEFQAAVNRFSEWTGHGGHLFMSWSNTDLYMLCESYMRFFSSSYIPFIKQYMDLQKFCQCQFPDLDGGNQISLTNAALKIGLEPDTDSLHRAAGDCVLSARCFIQMFDEALLAQQRQNCDKHFFNRLVFKPYYISNLDEIELNIDAFDYRCKECGGRLEREIDWESVNQSFRATFQCPVCCRKFWVTVRLRQEYDQMSRKIRIVQAKQKKRRRAKTQKASQGKD